MTQNPVIRSTPLMVALIGNLPAKRHPFGGLANFGDPANTIATVAIPSGDVDAFLRARMERFGVDINPTFSKGAKIDVALIAVAMELAKVAQRLSGFKMKDDQSFAIALEYATQSVFVDGGQVQPFDQYLPEAIELRQAYKAWNGAANAYSGKALEGEFDGVEQYFNDAVEAHETIARICRGNQHLSALRTTLQIRPIADKTAWNRFRGVSNRHRRAVYAMLITQITVTGNYRVTVEDIEQACAQIAGNGLMAAGSTSGVKASTVVNALTANPFGTTKANGGGKATARGMSATELGQRIAGLNAIADEVVVIRKDDDVVTIRVTLRDVSARGSRNSPSFGQTAVVVAPWATRRHASEQQPQA